MCNARIRQRQNGSEIGGQFTRVDHPSDPREMHGGDLDQEEQSPHALPSGSRLVRLRHGGEKDAARPQNREGAGLNLAADQIDDGVSILGSILNGPARWSMTSWAPRLRPSRHRTRRLWR